MEICNNKIKEGTKLVFDKNGSVTIQNKEKINLNQYSLPSGVEMVEKITYNKIGYDSGFISNTTLKEALTEIETLLNKNGEVYIIY